MNKTMSLYILTGYVEDALANAEYDKLDCLNFEHSPLKTSLSLLALSGSHQRRFSYIHKNV